MGCRYIADCEVANAAKWRIEKAAAREWRWRWRKKNVVRTSPAFQDARTRDICRRLLGPHGQSLQNMQGVLVDLGEGQVVGHILPLRPAKVALQDMLWIGRMRTRQTALPVFAVRHR